MITSLRAANRHEKQDETQNSHQEFTATKQWQNTLEGTNEQKHNPS